MRFITTLTFILFSLFLTAQNGWRVFEYPDAMPGSSIRDMSATGDSLIIATNQGLVIQTPNDRKYIDTTDGLKHNDVYEVCVKRSGEIILTYDYLDSIYIIKPNGQQISLPYKNKCPSSFAFFTVDDFDNVYVNCRDGGVYLLKETGLELIFSESRIYSSSSGPDNAIWGIEDNKLYKFKNGQHDDIIGVNDGSTSEIRRIAANENRVVYTNDKGELYSYIPNSGFEFIRDGFSIFSDIFIDSKDRVWYIKVGTTQNPTEPKLTYFDIDKPSIEQSISKYQMDEDYHYNEPMFEWRNQIVRGLGGGYMMANLDSEFETIKKYDLGDFSVPVLPDGTIGTKSRNEQGNQHFYKNGGLAYSLHLAAKGTNTSNQQELVTGGFSSEIRQRFDSTVFKSGAFQNDSNSKRNFITWKVTRSQIEDHIQNNNSAGYETPKDIESWPAHGLVNEGESKCLAPFIDVDNNGIYEPDKGDYPQIRGDQAVYTIFNDLRKSNQRPIEPIGLECHLMIYGYDSVNNAALSNTYFISYTIVNRGNNTYEDFKTSQFINGGIGGFNDDLMGVDTVDQYIYSVNHDDFDEGQDLSKGFGPNPPATALVSLSHDYTSFTVTDGDTASKLDYPYTPQEKVNYMDGYKADRSSYYTNSFRATNASQASGTPTKFVFSGSPYLNTGWTPISDQTISNDNHLHYNAGIASSYHGTFEPGDTIYKDLAFTVAENSSTGLYHELNDLDNQVSQIKQWFAQKQFDKWSRGCIAYNSVPDRDLTENSSFKLYPNPAENYVRIEFTDELNSSNQIEIFNTLGAMVRSQKVSGKRANIQLDNMPAGIYLVRVSGSDINETKRLIVN
ncbi:MAG: T9SS type A sorting domain-containing protein [Salibacter sp.]|uniref:T9SS type A sorting domain-containing protein n=1 Tax=Salibacter sp. TaxID=2010995 RepID=UPI0028703BE5|nr:T9SS type A sorting domain-containing protein [Salibacter sp.]MDR9399737.1 T9SS type A sorting domain-containing protein [Salibacter sp.]